MFGLGKKGKVKKLVDKALADNVLTDDEVKEIEQAAEEAGVSVDYINEIRQKHFQGVVQPILERIRKSQRFSPDDEIELKQICERLHVKAEFVDLMPYRKLWEIESSGTFEPEPIEVDIRLGKAEECYHAAPAVWAQLKTIRTRHGYVGGSVGFRVAKGVTLRLGKAVPSYSESEEVVDISDGTLYVTNKKLLFDGDRRSTTVTHKRIVSCEVYTDGIGVKKTSGKPDLFRLEPLDIEFVDALLQVI